MECGELRIIRLLNLRHYWRIKGVILNRSDDKIFVKCCKQKLKGEIYFEGCAIC